jgi:hypothetical protein
MLFRCRIMPQTGRLKKRQTESAAWARSGLPSSGLI